MAWLEGEGVIRFDDLVRRLGLETFEGWLPSQDTRGLPEGRYADECKRVFEFEPGKLTVKVVDIFGNNTMTIVEVQV